MGTGEGGGEDRMALKGLANRIRYSRCEQIRPSINERRGVAFSKPRHIFLRLFANDIGVIFR